MSGGGDLARWCERNLTGAQAARTRQVSALVLLFSYAIAGFAVSRAAGVSRINPSGLGGFAAWLVCLVAAVRFDRQPRAWWYFITCALTAQICGVITLGDHAHALVPEYLVTVFWAALCLTTAQTAVMTVVLVPVAVVASTGSPAYGAGGSAILVGSMMGGVVLIHSVVVGIRSLAGRLDDARAEAERLAATDALTGVANRREFNRTLRNTDARHHHARGVLIADIDHFKQINDSLGHLYGDDVLAAVGQSLVSSFPNGLVARWGGEEFAVLTEPIDQERLELAAAAACLAVSSSTVATISIGAVLWTPGVSVEAALVAADRALYEAKAAGRNRAHVARRAAVSAPA